VTPVSLCHGAALNRRAPHGGFKQSGMGREWGRFGIEEFLATGTLDCRGIGDRLMIH
jgi:acyl-CoA reductase-like NAD-dependent aldehyde dehydrogenase